MKNFYLVRSPRIKIPQDEGLYMPFIAWRVPQYILQTYWMNRYEYQSF